MRRQELCVLQQLLKGTVFDVGLACVRQVFSSFFCICY